MGRRKRYSAEFTQAALKQANEPGVPDLLVAEELGISARQLRRWRDAVKRNGDNAFPGQGKSRDEELTKLKRKLAIGGPLRRRKPGTGPGRLISMYVCTYHSSALARAGFICCFPKQVDFSTIGYLESDGKRTRYREKKTVRWKLRHAERKLPFLNRVSVPENQVPRFQMAVFSSCD